MSERKKTTRVNRKEKQSVEKSKMLVLKNGRTYRIMQEQGKYYMCEGTQFRKSNPNILEVRIVQERT